MVWGLGPGRRCGNRPVLPPGRASDLTNEEHAKELNCERDREKYNLLASTTADQKCN